MGNRATHLCVRMKGPCLVTTFFRTTLRPFGLSKLKINGIATVQHCLLLQMSGYSYMFMYWIKANFILCMNEFRAKTAQAVFLIASGWGVCRVAHTLVNFKVQ